MKKAVIIFSAFLLIFLGVNAFATQYDFFGGFIPEGTPTIDGVITSGEWNEAGHRTLYKFFGEDSKIDIYLMWDKNNLYVAADIEDYTLWVDNYDPSKSWESTWNDDAFKIEIDPDFSRHENLQSSDRVFAINANGSANRFDQGDGAGSTIGATIIDTIQKAVKYSGTFNDYTFKTITSDTQKDGGFVVEVAIPWKNLFGSSSAVAPTVGYSIGMNFTNIDDAVSGQLDAAYYKEWKRVYDEITRFMGEEGHPENWAEFVLSSNNDTTSPAAITGLTTGSTSAYSTIINFMATGDNDMSGYAKSYDIRYSTSAISESNWDTAVVYSNSFRPRKAGKSETFKLTGFTPNITYYLGIKAVDEMGNSSQLSTTSFTALSASSASDKGFITVCPGQRYFCRENGSPVVIVGDNQGMPWPYIRTFYNGQMWDQSMSKYRNFYQEEGPQKGRDYLNKLSGYGVNTLRIMAEAYDIDNPVYLTTSMSGGPSSITFNQDTLNFLKTFLDECAKYDINVIIVPFDTFYYKEKWSKVTFSTSKGGPMSSSSDMFNSSYRDYLKAILNKLVQTIGDRKNLLAWDLMNEFDSDDPDFGWNSATFSAREDTLNAMADYMRSIDPNHMIYVSSVRWDPKFSAHLDQSLSKSAVGSDAAVILNNQRFDFNSTHQYYHDIRDPNYNTPNNMGTPYFTYQVSDLDNTIAPAARIKQGLQFYYATTVSPKPYLDTEAGPIKFFTKAYDQFFTKEDDYQYFHNMIWVHLASGDAGTGLRWPGDMLSDHALPDQMRKYQKALKNFVSNKLDFAAFNPVQIGQYMEIGNTSIPVIKTGITDGSQGIVFLVKDTRKSAYGTISGARLTIPKLSAGKLYTIEFWDSDNSDLTGHSSSVSATADSQGKAIVNLPDFNKTLAIKFYAECNLAISPSSQAFTSTGGTGSVTVTASGSGCSAWTATSSLNWVTITSGNSGTGSGSVSFSVAANTTGATRTGNITVAGQSFTLTQSATNTTNGTSVTNDLWIRAVINTVEKGPVDAIWQKGGEATTARGDRVIWGHFYASPSDVFWGSKDNPDLYVKIWFDVNGRVDVNYFHVSVPDIAVYSSYKGRTTLQGTTTTSKRYIRQYYQNNTGVSEENTEDGIPAPGYNPNHNPPGNTTINNMRIGAVINTVEKGGINAVWRLGGQTTTARGDQVLWGHFYANPSDVSWGNQDNPDLFVKIWFDVSGRIDVNFFHVSVPDIEVYSDYPSDGTYNQRGTTITSDRYIRQQYTR